MAINMELVPAGMNVVKEVTPHCFINGEGQVVFLRRMNGSTEPVILKTIYDAISQCCHILDGILGEVMDFYRRQPKVFGEGELGEIREVVLQLQSSVQMSISAGVVPKDDVVELQRAFQQVVRRLGRVRNKHKVLLAAYLGKTSALRDEKGMRHIGAVLEPVQAHLAAVKRFDELDGISQGVMVQAQRLMGIAINAEERIRRAYDNLSRYEEEAQKLVLEIDEHERTKGVQPVLEYISRFRAIANHVAGLKVNKVLYALRAVVAVEPFRSRLGSREIERLASLHDYLDKWEKGKTGAVMTFVNALKGARSKLKRVARERTGGVYVRAMRREYQPRLQTS